MKSASCICRSSKGDGKDLTKMKQRGYLSKSVSGHQGREETAQKEGHVSETEGVDSCADGGVHRRKGNLRDKEPEDLEVAVNSETLKTEQEP